MVPTVSVIVPTLGRQVPLRHCLAALNEQTHPDIEILIVHDGPRPDATLSLVSSYGGKYLGGSARGVIAAYNLGLRAATGDIVAFTDDDAVPDRDWLANLVSTYAKGVGGVGGTVFPSQVLGQAGTTIRYPIQIFPDGHIGNWTIVGDQIFEVDHLRGANMSFTKDAVIRTGLFDSNYVADGFRFESDYCTRVKRRGLKLLFNPVAIVIHSESEIRDVPRMIRSPKRMYYHTRNDTYFTLKNFMLGRNSIKVSKRMCLRGFRMLRHTVTRRDVGYASGFFGLVAGAFCYAFEKPRDS